MKNIELKYNEQFRLLVRLASEDADPQTAALATALADGSQALTLDSLARLTNGVLATEKDLLICALIDYLVSQGIMFPTDDERGLRGLWKRVCRAFSEMVSRGRTPSPNALR